MFRIAAARPGAQQNAHLSHHARHHHRRRRGDRHGRHRRRRQSDDVRRRSRAWATNVLIVLPGTSNQGGVRAGFGSVNTLVDGDASAMTRELRPLPYASPVLRRQEQAGRREPQLGDPGARRGAGVSTDSRLADRRRTFLHDGDVESAAKVAVSAQTVARHLFGNDDPSIASIRIRNVPFRVVGVLGRQRRRPARGRIRTISS